ncbi:MAG: hypothetical protein ACE5JS_18625 [Nitrospinota bacterium]
MMRQTVRLFAPLAALVLLSHVLAGSAQTAQKGSGKTTVIEVHNGFVSPSTLAIPRGTTVILQNYSGRFMNVNFTRGQPAGKSCSAPDSSRPPEGDYPSLNISPAGKTSFCLLAPGTYYFTVLREGPWGLGTVPAYGTIIVREE